MTRYYPTRLGICESLNLILTKWTNCIPTKTLKLLKNGISSKVLVDVFYISFSTGAFPTIYEVVLA